MACRGAARLQIPFVTVLAGKSGVRESRVSDTGHANAA